jgi:5-methylthioadenosine/S-adenosylhomocysteine deaminase
MVPMYNPYSVLVYSANAGNVRHSIVAGKVIMQDRNMLTVDEKQIIAEAIEFTKKVRKTVIENGEEVI